MKRVLFVDDEQKSLMDSGICCANTGREMEMVFASET